MIGQLQAAWMIRYAVLQDRLGWTRVAPALFKPEYVAKLKADLAFAHRMVMLHGTTKS